MKSQNIQVRVFISDDDSSSIYAVRNACNHPVVKHSDKNHTSKDVANILYIINKRSDTNKELTSEAIKYLHRCFTYAVSQNPGNPDNVAAAIRNIHSMLLMIIAEIGAIIRKIQKIKHIQPS